MTKKKLKKASTKATKSGKRSTDLPAVRVRMYRQGLGDCFLITFDLGRKEKHMLIDCGTLGTRATKVTIKEVLNHIAKTTGGNGNLEILVATHAHKDHVSGFRSEKETLTKFKINNVWMGWTEDPSDKLAKKLGNKAKALAEAVGSALAMSQASASLREKLSGLSEFEDMSIDANGQLAMGATIAEALDIVRKFNGAKTSYHSPGTPAIELDEIPGFRFYVLGPPRDADKLANMGDHGSDELYGLANALKLHASDLLCDKDAPFDARFCHPIENAGAFYSNYDLPEEKYRRIDNQWMQAAAELAAKLDNFRNNTSLALAIERIGDGRVLLFPADAQQGNWLSWYDSGMEWKTKDANGKSQTVNAIDLLTRTVFYKVGHHSSQNATAKGKGLEIMRRNKELIAFIPVDRKVALGKSPRGSWQMPAKPLYREILEACDGRVVRADLGWADDARLASDKTTEEKLLNTATEEEWNHWRKSQSEAERVKVDPEEIYFEFLLE